MTTPRPLGTRLLAEGLGTGLLVTAVVGSGIHAERLSPGDIGLQLLESSTATAPGFLAAQLTGALLAVACCRVLFPQPQQAEATPVPASNGERDPSLEEALDARP